MSARTGSDKELSLAENVSREALHPADEFEAFRDLQDNQGLGAETIAARFGVTPRVVKERLKLGAVKPALIQLYREGGMTLEQLMAFTVTDDHVRQQEVWDNLVHNRSPERIRRVLLETHVPATDRRAQFVTVAAYEAAGGVIVRDLFSEDGGGYLADAVLLDRLAQKKIEEAAEALRAEGWKWVEGTIDFPHHHGLARIYPRDVELPEAEIARLDEIEAELDPLYAELESAAEPDPELERQIASLTAEYDAIDERKRVFDPDALARAGAIVCIGPDGTAEIARGFVRPEDVPVEEPKPRTHRTTAACSRRRRRGSDRAGGRRTVPTVRRAHCRSFGASHDGASGGGFASSRYRPCRRHPCTRARLLLSSVRSRIPASGSTFIAPLSK